MSYRLEKTDAGYDIVIDGFELGIAETPYKGIGDMRNVDPITTPGEVSVAMKTAQMNTQGRISAVAFTVDPATDIFTYDGVVPLELNTAITFANSGGALPTGLSANTPYYILSIPTPTTFTISESAGGSQKLVSSAGTGTNTFSTINMGTPKFIRHTTIIPQPDVGGLSSAYWYFLLDSNGRCWVYDGAQAFFGNTKKWIYMNNLSSESSTNSGNGLVAWKNWLFIFTSTSVRAIPLINANASTPSFLSTKANWAEPDGWDLENLSLSTISHYAMVGQDDAVYFCNGYFVGSILEIEGETFAPNTARTGTDGQTTDNDPTFVSASASFSILDIGSTITGDNIPADTYIKSINSPTSVELNNDATATATGTDWAIPDSHTFNGEALALPKTDQAVCLAELGVNLLVGGMNNFIYPWNRTSTSFFYPIFLAENYVSRMVTINTTTYIFCGRRGRIYQTNGSNANLFYKVADFLSQTVNPTFIWFDATFSRKLLFFGFQVKSNGGTTINQYGGLWAVDPDIGGGWLINQLSYATYAGYAAALYPFLGESTNPSPSSTSGIFGDDTGYGIFAGWNDGTNGGIDRGDSDPYTGGESYIDSDMIPVGTFLTKKTFQNIEFKLSAPLVAGELVALYYRTSINGAFTLVPLTAGGATGDVSGYANVNFEQIQWLQVRAVLTSTLTTPSFVRLRELRIR